MKNEIITSELEEEIKEFIASRTTVANPYDVSEIVNLLVDGGCLDARKKEPKRDYLGCSQIGDECLRKLQYTFQQKEGVITPRGLRIFDIGKALEGIMIQWLRQAGFRITTHNTFGDQLGFSTADGKIAGHVDGIIYEIQGLNSKIPLPCILECKTMNSSNWKETVKHGVFVAKPTYYTQVQLYMAYMDMGNTLLFALNKDTAELYAELIPFDAEHAQCESDKAANVIKATMNNEESPRISENPTFFRCKMCEFQHFCHGKIGE